MTVEVTQANLSRALSSLARVASARSTLPILSNVLIQTDGNRLKLSATNLEIAITHWVGAKVKEAGSITVPARLLNDFISSLPGGNVTLKQDGAHIDISSSTYQSRINGMASDEFPSLPKISGESKVSIPAEELKSSLAQVLPAVSGDDARPVLTGVNLYSNEGQLVWVATDSYRLAEKTTTTATPKDLSLLIPARTLSELLKLLEDSEKVDMEFDDSQVKFVVGGSEMVSRLIEGKFPAYRQLIPKENDNSATVERAEFINITKVASLFAREAAGSVTLEVDEAKQTIAIKSIASQVGENTSSATAKVSGEGSVTLNSKYLLEALNVMDEDEVKFDFSGKLSPCVLTGSKQKTDYTHVIMPLRS